MKKRVYVRIVNDDLEEDVAILLEENYTYRIHKSKNGHSMRVEKHKDLISVYVDSVLVLNLQIELHARITLFEKLKRLIYKSSRIPGGV